MKYGLIGEKLGHSFSKVIHSHLGDYEYELKEIARNDLESFMTAKDFLGINITMPYKKDVIPYLDWIDESARKIGAVNTIINRDGRLYGYNTDYLGMIALFDHAGVDAKGKKAVILGTGGTSRTAEAVLTSLGAAEIIKVTRGDRNGAVSYCETYERHNDAEIIVNTTPSGMYPDVYGCPIDLSRLHHLSGVIDAVYNPINTTLVKTARDRGISAEGGLYMLVGQAVKASELFLDTTYSADTLSNIYEKVRAEKENIVLIGMPASGKSTVGKILGERLGRRFVDTDDIITERIGMPISDFFKSEGEKTFRQIETDVIKELSGEASLVIATGGGAVLKEENTSALKYNGRLYFLDRPLGKLVPTKSRPLSSDAESIKKRYDERYHIYCDRCDVKIDADCTAEEVADKILEKFQ